MQHGLSTRWVYSGDASFAQFGKQTVEIVYFSDQMSEIFSGFEKQAVIKEVTQVQICISSSFFNLLVTTKVHNCPKIY